MATFSNISNSLHPSFSNLPHLKTMIHIVMTNNKLRSFPTEHIAGLPQLRDWYFGINLIEDITNMSYLPELRTIRLSNNLIMCECLRKLSLEPVKTGLLNDDGSWLIPCSHRMGIILYVLTADAKHYISVFQSLPPIINYWYIHYGVTVCFVLPCTCAPSILLSVQTVTQTCCP